MADWRQIRARIRRAKAGPDAASRLEQLYDKTRDGMVAFELAQLEELSGRMERAIDWYKRAWERFRRAEWKRKAEEALVRHGAPIPVSAEGEALHHAHVTLSHPSATEPAEDAAIEPEREPARPAERGTLLHAAAEEEMVSIPEPEPAHGNGDEIRAAAGAPGQGHPRRHRGGRGRGRRKPRTEGAPQPTAEPGVPTPSPEIPRRREPERHVPAEHHPARHPAREHLPPVQIYRRGEPALASEIKGLEAKLRQLLASPPHSIDDLSELPASPGVYLVSDLDLTTMYYVEACGNMRAAMDQLISGRRGRKGSVRTRLGKYLGINDSQASRYLKEHCIARWIDLEESDAGALGHFARAVLRPNLMEGSD